MPIKCFDKIPDLAKVFEKRLKEGMSEHEQRVEGLKAATEYYKNLYNEVESFKKEVNPEYIPKKLLLPNRSKEIKAIKSEYRSKIYEAIKEAEGTSPIEEPVPDSGNTVGITHAATEEIRAKFGLGDYERKNATDAELEAQADDAISKGYNIDVLIKQMESGLPPTGAENFILKKYVAGLDAKVAKDPSDKNIAEVERVVRATDKIGSLQSEAFRTRRGLYPSDDSLASFFVREKEVNKDAPLTESQKETVIREHDEIKKAQADFDKKMAELQAENIRLRAEAEVKSAKNKKRPKKDYSAAKQEVYASISEKLKKIRSESNVTIVPYAKELIAIAPDVAKLVKILADEGLVKLSEFVDNIHEKLKGDIPDVTKKDVIDLIAGEYSEKKQTRQDAARKMHELKAQAILINKLEKLQSGIEPKTEKKKIERNQEIENLRKQIKEHDLTKLSEYKRRTQDELDKVESQLKKDVFEKPEKTQIPLDAEAIGLKDKLIKARQQRELRLLQQEYANRTQWEKAKQNTLEVLNVPRTIMSSMDFSAPLRQGLWAGISHPRTAGLAGIEMFRQSISQKRFDRWFYDLRQTPRYQTMEKSGLYVSDPHDPRLSSKEEAFMNNLAEKIPFIGKLIKGSERAYVSFLNKMRVDLFNRFTDRYEEQGRTVENDPQLYKSLADYINNSTGRGKLGPLESYAPLFNTMFFSPRLMASRINLLTNPFNPKFYKTVPKEVRLMYAKDLFKFLALGTSVLALASLNPDNEVEDDPRSSDFGRIKNGNTRWDIWGGFQPYVRLAAQLITGEKKSTGKKEIQELDGKGRFGTDRGDIIGAFFRGKLAPVPSMAVDFIKGKTATGQDVTILSEAEGHLLPLLYSDLKQAVKERGVSAYFTVGLPSVFGVGVNTYSPYKSKAKGGSRQIEEKEPKSIPER